MSRIYTVDDIDRRNPELQDVMRATARHLTVEFLQQGGPKPHVIFKINFDSLIQIDRLSYSGCRLGMEYVGGNGGLGGEFQIKLINYVDATIAAHAAFQFDISQAPQQPLSEYINLFRGRTGTTGGDLTRFNFVEATAAGALDGCRDFITQCFIRLHQNRMVQWEAIGVAKGELGHNSREVLRSFNFHDLIGNDYQTRREHGTRRTYVIPFPLHRGTFLDGFQRIENYQGCQLPYIPQTQAPEYAAASSGYPSGGGSYYGQGGHGSYDAGGSSYSPYGGYQGSYGSSSGGRGGGESSRSGRERHYRR